MIVDFHTHIFPPEVIEHRDEYVRDDPTFRLLYADPKAKLATAEDLLQSMVGAAIDVSVALGFAWSSLEAVELHNQYLAEVSTQYASRIVPFFALPPGANPRDLPRTNTARGFGELRPENTGFDLQSEQGEALASLSVKGNMPLLFHVSEPVGHTYPGKEGLDVAAFYRFVAAHPNATAIGAHWAGGLPFYASMPEVRRLFDANVYVDTAATSLLYDGAIYERVAGLVGAGRILFGSDFPLLSQERSRQRIEASGLDAGAKALILGDNAARLLGLS